MYQKRNNILNVLSLYLGDYNKEFYLRELSRVSDIPLKTTQTAIDYLTKEKILKPRMHGKNKYFRLNLENIETKHYLLQAEIAKTIKFLSAYPIFKTFLKEIKTDAPIIIFGSYAKFTKDKNSDLDILIVGKEKLPEHILPIKIHKIEIKKETFIKMIKEKENLIKEIEENHIILNNHSFYLNRMWDYYAK